MSREALRVVEGHPLSARFTAEGIVLGKGDSGPLSGGKARTIALRDPDCLQCLSEPGAIRRSTVLPSESRLDFTGCSSYSAAV